MNDTRFLRPRTDKVETLARFQKTPLVSDLGDLAGLDTSAMSPDQVENARRMSRLLRVNQQAAADDLIAQATATRTRRLHNSRSVQLGIQNDFRSGWELADALVHCLQQNSALLLESSRDCPEEDRARKLALAVVHSAGTLFIQEIHTLARTGFWAGAAARWRSLHELAVTANALMVGGAPIARRYLDHGLVVQTKRLLDFFEVHRRGPVPEPELRLRANQSKELVARHTDPQDSAPFTAPYAWASPLMPADRNGLRRRPTLPEIEKVVGYEGSRLLVNSAHGVVHGDSAGVVAAVAQDHGWALGPSGEGIPNVMRMTARTSQRLIGSVCFGFESSFGVEDDHFSLLGAAAIEIAQRVIEEFADSEGAEDREEEAPV